MPRDTLVRDVMTTEVVTLHPDESIEAATRKLLDRDVDGAPVVDGTGAVVGMLTTDDLIVQEKRLHYPTVISLFGAYLELPSSHRQFEAELRKAVGAKVEEVMTADPVVCTDDITVEQAATIMYDEGHSRLPVVRDGRLVGIVARGDVVRSLLLDQG